MQKALDAANMELAEHKGNGKLQEAELTDFTDKAAHATEQLKELTETNLQLQVSNQLWLHVEYQCVQTMHNHA